MSSLNDFVTERAATRVGAVLRGKWKLERIIGVGGMATVYAATHRNQSRVAIKVLHPEVSMDADVTARFLREGYVANVIDHSGTVKVLDDDVTEDGAPFLVMELLEGETVDARWERKLQRLPISEVLAIGDQILDVLAAAHDKGVVHRDLKPENLFLTQNGELRVLDFGIARLREVSSSSESSTQTRAGSLLGTPAFMAPEQARGRWEEVDARTDIWAVGATLFTLIAGRFVHESDTVQEQLIRAATVSAPSLATLAPEVSPAIVTLIDRALAFDKNQRWPDARSMQAALRAATSSEDRDAPLTLPVPSRPVDSGETETIAVPRHMLPTNPTYSTARPVTHAVASSVATQRSWKPFYAVAAVVLVALAGVAGIVVYNHSHTPVAPANDQPVQAAQPPPTAIDTAAPTVTVVTTEKAAPTPATPTTSAKPVLAEQRPSLKPTAKPTTKKHPDGETKPEALVPTSKPTGNPFDRRF